MPKRSVLLIALLLAIGVVPAHRVEAQPAAVDPQSLVGEWEGRRTRWTSDGQSEVRWYLLIERVEGDKIYLKRETPGVPTVSFVGILTGNQLTFGQTNAQITFTVDGNRMTSKYNAPNGMRLEYDLRKK